jgi:hypothetical protein
MSLELGSWPSGTIRVLVTLLQVLLELEELSNTIARGDMCLELTKGLLVLAKYVDLANAVI